MIDEIKEVREVTETKETVIGEVMKCDVCGKIIYDSRKDDGILMHNNQHWWSLTTGHNDWGNDSIDSVEQYDICSPECLKVKFDEYCKDSNREINSMYFEVSHDRR